MGRMSIVVCDDHEIVREAIRRRIEADDGLKVVGEAADGEQVRAVVVELRPDLLITDVELPGSNGIAAATELLEEVPELKVLVLSAHEEPELISFVEESGASGFIAKSNVTTEILPAIAALREGRRWFPVRTDRGKDLGEGLRRLLSLSPRERQVLDLFATGLRAQGVSEEIGIRPATVYTHVRNAIHKLNVDSRTQAVAIAVRYRYLTNDAD